MANKYQVASLVGAFLLIAGGLNFFIGILFGLNLNSTSYTGPTIPFFFMIAEIGIVLIVLGIAVILVTRMLHSLK